MPTALFRRSGILGLLLSRVAVALVLVFIVSTLVFVATEALPGDAATAILGRDATPANLAAERRELGLDKPAAERYFNWLKGFATGDLGDSATLRQPVSDLIARRGPNTFGLAVCAMAVMLPLGLILGALAALRPGRLVDHVISGVTLAFIALPEFIVGTLLAVFIAVKAGWVPPVSLLAPGESPFDHLLILVLPVITITLVGVAYMVRMLRAGLIEVLNAEYVDMARLHGIPERRVIMTHAFRNCLAPTVSVIALTMAWLLSGAAIVEVVFSYPGLGSLLIQGVVTRDIPLVQGLAVVIAVVTVGVNLIADICVVLLVPKLRALL